MCFKFFNFNLSFPGDGSVAAQSFILRAVYFMSTQLFFVAEVVRDSDHRYEVCDYALIAARLQGAIDL